MSRGVILGILGVAVAAVGAAGTWWLRPTATAPDAAPARPASEAIAFADHTAASGVVFTLANGAAGGFYLPELMPGGLAAVDVDNDECVDLFFTNGASSPAMEKSGAGFSNRLFRNQCNGTFVEISDKAGVAGAGYSMAAATGDYDNDGDADLFVAGVNRNQLLRNRGDATFEDVTERSGLTGVDSRGAKPWSVAAGWFDADNDGRLDLFVVNYVKWAAAGEPRCESGGTRFYCHPDLYGRSPSQLFRNNGDGTFADISLQSGIGAHDGKGMGVAFADFNADGLADVFVTNDSMRNFLFVNRGGGRFEEMGLELGVAYGEMGRPVAGMGTHFQDVDNDGLPDIVLSAMVNDGYLLLRNTGGPDYLFDDATIASGLAQATRQLTGWGLGLIDFDNDGWRDLFTANSHFPQLSRYLGTPSPLPNSIIQNVGGGRFADVTATAGEALKQARYFRGAAFGDFDRDGLVDVAVTAINAPAMLLRNTTAGAGGWIGFRLRGTRANRDGLGTKITVTLADGRTLTGSATTSVGYASSSERIVRFGLGASSVRSVELDWPGGTRQQLQELQSGRIITVIEPET
jgi:hypothetical protein